MTERVVIRLSEKWAILADDCQWIVATARQRRAQRYWHPLRYIATTKAVLERNVRETGAIVDDTGRLALAGLPDTFRQWRDGQRRELAA